jgi:hypothetical protein
MAAVYFSLFTLHFALFFVSLHANYVIVQLIIHYERQQSYEHGSGQHPYPGCLDG